MPYPVEYRPELPPITGGSQERRKKGDSELQPTHLPGVFLKVAPGEEVNLSRSAIEVLHRAGEQYAPADFQQKDLEKLKRESRSDILPIAQSHQNLRGIVDEEKGWEITIIPEVRKEWNQEILERSLGILYTSYVFEDLILTINIAHGTIDKVKVKTAVREALRGLGIDDDGISQIMKEEISLRLDEDGINQLVADGKPLLPGAKEEKVIWKLRPDKIE